jgi:hypothetical protein
MEDKGLSGKTIWRRDSFETSAFCPPAGFLQVQQNSSTRKEKLIFYIPFYKCKFLLKSSGCQEFK